jgi:hypothetical protein
MSHCSHICQRLKPGRRTRQSAAMQTTAAETVVPAPPDVVFPAVMSLVESTWCVRPDDVIDAAPPVRLLHSVALDGEIACWLSWHLTPSETGYTHVRLVHDELSTLPAPAPDLVTILRLLRDSVTVREQR